MEKRKGFTLIELMVVMIILAILVTFGIGSFTSSQKKSRDIKRKNDLRQIGVSLEAYNNDKGEYPNASAGGLILGCLSGVECAWGSAFVDSNNTVYMMQLPTDPTTTRRYVYIVAANRKSYQLYTVLENTLDADIPKDAQNKARVFTDVNCGSTTTMHCNFGVASSNTLPETGRTVSYE
jgi:type II secretion system protein G